jgi:hypothetical protein
MYQANRGTYGDEWLVFEIEIESPKIESPSMTCISTHYCNLVGLYIVTGYDSCKSNYISKA